MKVNKNTMRAIERIVLVLLCIMGMAFVVSCIAELFDAHIVSYYSITVACITGMLAMSCVIFEPA